MRNPNKKSNVRSLFDDPRLIPVEEWTFPSALDDIEIGDEISISNVWKHQDIAVFTWDGMRKPKRKDWPVLFQSACLWLANSGLLNAIDTRVFLHIYGTAGYGEPIVLVANQLAKRWKVAPASVSRSLNKLLNLNIILKTDTNAKQRAFRLNPNFGSGLR